MTEKKCYTDPELEKFFKENKAIVEKILDAEKQKAKNIYEIEKAKIETSVKEHKEKVKGKVNDISEIFLDPDVQKHFMTAGMEFMRGLNALAKAIPLPDSVKEAVENTGKTGKEVLADTVKKTKTATQKAKTPEKIIIKNVSSKKTT